VVAVLTHAGTYARFVLRSRISLLADKNAWLTQQLEVARDYRPDVLAQGLAERLRVLSGELERLHADHKANAEAVRQKESELGLLRTQIKDLGNELAPAQEALRVIADRHPDLPASDSDVPTAFGRDTCGQFIRGGINELDDYVEAGRHPHAPFALSQAQEALLPNADGGNNPIGGGFDA